MIAHEYDVIVVGARIAGSTVAAFLGDAGYRVLLLDRARFPSPTLSTHFFRGEFALSVFKRLGILDELLALGSPPLVHQYMYFNGTAEAIEQPAQSPGDIGYCLSVGRQTLDAILVRRAQKSASVELVEGTHITSLIREDGRVVGVRLQNDDGEQTVRARIVIGADGRKSFVARAVNAAFEESVPGFRTAYYRYVRNYRAIDGSVPDAPEFSLRGDEVVFVFPSDDDVTCVAISVSLEDFRTFKRAAATNFEQHIARHRGIADRFFESARVGKLLACGPEPNYVRVPIGAGWALAGDAGLHQDPWSGLGIDQASTQGEYLAQALSSWFSGAANETDALTGYHQRRNETGVPQYQSTVSVGRDLRQLSPE